MNAQFQCKSILLIEDDDDIRNTIQDLLEMENYKVYTARNGKEGIDLLATSVTHPCLILLDLMMPVMDGNAFIREVKRNNADSIATIPIIITSAAGEAARTAAKIVDGLIKKPIQLEILPLWRKAPALGPGDISHP